MGSYYYYYLLLLKNQDYGDISAQNTKRVPNNMQQLKLGKLKQPEQREMFQLEFENVK